MKISNYSPITQEAISSIIATDATAFQISSLTTCLNAAAKNERIHLLQPLHELLNKRLSDFNGLIHSPDDVIIQTREVFPIHYN